MSDACTGYGVSYIAEAPQEFKVGDRIVVVNKADDLFMEQGAVVSILIDGGIRIKFDNKQDGIYDQADLRKLPDTDNPLDKQVGGSHYKDMAIQPVEFCMKNNLDFCTSSAIKYLCRRKKKNGKEDLLKAKHFIDLLIQLEYPE